LQNIRFFEALIDCEILKITDDLEELFLVGRKIFLQKLPSELIGILFIYIYNEKIHRIGP
jgi:hypothetical protein